MHPVPKGRRIIRRNLALLVSSATLGAGALIAPATGLAADTTAPTLSISGFSAGATLSASTYVTAWASDSSGISSVKFYVDGAWARTDTTKKYTFTLKPAGLKAGSHSLKVLAKDRAGNYRAVSRSFKTGPAVETFGLTLVAPSDGAALSDPRVLTATSSLATNISFYLDGDLVASGDASPFAWTFQPEELALGVHTVRVVATDALGATKELTRSYEVVSTPPPPPPDLGTGNFTQMAWTEVSGEGPIAADEHDPFDYHQIVAPDRLVAVSSPRMGVAPYSARFQVKDGDKGGGSQSGERNEIMQGGSNKPTEAEGSSAYYSIGMYFPSDFSAPTWTILHQMHGSYPGSSPVVAVQADKGSELQIIRRGGNPNSPTVVRHVVETDITKDVWHEFVYFVHWKADSTGVLRVWHRRAGIDAGWDLVVDDNGPVGYRDSSGWYGPYPKLGVYRSESISGTTTVYQGGIRLRAATFADAEGLFAG